MRYRKLDANGDYTFGGSQNDFFTGINATAQACKTRLKLWRETFWRDLDAGVPFVQSILNARATSENLEAINAILQGVISGTPDVTGVFNSNVAYNPATRQISYTALVQTLYSERPLFVEIG